MKLDVETRIKLNKFKPRFYQKPIFDAIENKGYRRVLVVMPRRAGKDITAFNLMVRQALKVIGVYYYVFPTYSQAKKVIWDAITNSGERFLDYIPRELVTSKNGQEMKITLVNNSLIQLVGSDNIDSLVGTNPRGVIFSEYALQSPLAYQFLRPILLANDGWALFISTPRGRNHMYELYQIAKHSPDWWCTHLSVTDTKHIPLAEIEKEKAEGLMSEDLIQQEYYCDFHIGIEGSYYSKYINRMRLNSQIADVPWEPNHKVHTSWDLGVRDSTAIIFFQCIGTIVRIIDTYEKNKEGLEHYITILNEKPYTYGKHFAPHDIRVRDFSLGITRWEKARQLGITFTTVDKITVEDGIEAVRSTLAKTWIDEIKCGNLIRALENYRQEYDSKKRVYKPKPLHNEFSHMADSMRYLAISLPKTADGLTSSEIDKNYRKAMYGEEENLPKFFRE